MVWMSVNASAISLNPSKGSLGAYALLSVQDRTNTHYAEDMHCASLVSNTVPEAKKVAAA